MRKENTVQKSFEQGRFPAPPHWKGEHEMVAPLNGCGSPLQIRLPRLATCIASMQDGIEIEFGQRDPHHLDADGQGRLIEIEQMG
jgi:hypothetical protein